MATTIRREPAQRTQVTGRRKLSRLRAGKDRGLSVLEVRFAEEYLLDLNAKQAAIRAGYSPKGADVAGCRLLSRERVAEKIRELNAERSKRTGITADRVVKELAIVAFADIGDLADWGPDGVKLKPSKDVSPDARRAVAEVSESRTAKGGVHRRIKQHDKVAALIKLGEHFGLWKPERAADRPVNIIVDLVPAGFAVAGKGAA